MFAVIYAMGRHMVRRRIYVRVVVWQSLYMSGAVLCGVKRYVGKFI